MGNSSMEEIKTLDNLALEARHHPPKSRERVICLTKLIQEIQKSNQLRCKNSKNQPFSIYQEVFNNALQQTLLEIFKKIDEYNPEKAAFLAWVKSLLHYRCLDAWNEYFNVSTVQENGKKKKISPLPLDAPTRGGEQSKPEMSGSTFLDNLVQPDLESSDQQEWHKLRNLIEEDPTGCFRTTHIKGHPEANFQVIALRRFEEQSWKVMSQEWGISLPTISSFYQRCIEKFQSVFKEYL